MIVVGISQKKVLHQMKHFFLEVGSRFELLYTVLQTAA